MSNKHIYKEGDYIGSYYVLSCVRKPESKGKHKQVRNFVTVRHTCGYITEDVRPYELYKQRRKCAGCEQTRPRVGYKRQSVMIVNARRRAKQQNVPFDITDDDIIIPDTCPLLGIPLFTNTGGAPCPNSPTLDKLIPHLGYVRSNILVISHRANSIKHNASIDELMLLTDNLHNILISKSA